MNATPETEMRSYAQSLLQLQLYKRRCIVAARADNAHVWICEAENGQPLCDSKQYGVHEGGAYADILAIFAARSDLYGLFFLDSPFSLTVSRTGKVMRASLDDTAQIAGGRIRTARSAAPADVLPCIRKNFGCFVNGMGQLTVGRSLHEAYVAALVLAKGARAEVQARPFGGAKPIGAFDCLLMRSVYLKKYSKIQEQKL